LEHTEEFEADDFPTDEGQQQREVTHHLEGSNDSVHNAHTATLGIGVIERGNERCVVDRHVFPRRYFESNGFVEDVPRILDINGSNSIGTVVSEVGNVHSVIQYLHLGFGSLVDSIIHADVDEEPIAPILLN
jgi:hypothetical protein